MITPTIPGPLIDDLHERLVALSSRQAEWHRQTWTAFGTRVTSDGINALVARLLQLLVRRSEPLDVVLVLDFEQSVSALTPDDLFAAHWMFAEYRDEPVYATLAQMLGFVERERARRQP